MRKVLPNLKKRLSGTPGRHREYTVLGTSAAVLVLILALLLLPDNTADNDVATLDVPEQAAAPETGLSQPIIRNAPPEHEINQEVAATDTAPTDEPDGPFGDSLIPVLPHAGQDPVYIALIIDDIGNNAAAGQRAIALPADITFAILPHTPHGRSLAEQAHAVDKEIMLHAPMSNMGDMPLGPGGLTPELTEDEFEQVLNDSLAAIPFVRGVNNHTGSRLTAMPEQMQWLMDLLNARELYFVDSVTTTKSVAGDLADLNEVPNLRRQVFLDHDSDPASIDHEFRRMLDIAIREGQAVGIGHPYPETLDYLERMLPLLPAHNIHLVFVSSLL